MSDVINRLKVEKEELDVKIKSLKAMLNSANKIKEYNISDTQVDLMHMQYTNMKGYTFILGKRISDLMSKQNLDKKISDKDDKYKPYYRPELNNVDNDPRS